MLANLANQLPDGTLRIACTAAAEEERGVLFPESIETSVGADGLSCGLRRSLPAVDCLQKVLEHVRRIGHSCDMREVDPGQDAEEIEGWIARGLGQDYWHDGKSRIASLANQGKVAFVMLGVAKS